jgi:HlyD family secretion protein
MRIYLFLPLFSFGLISLIGCSNNDKNVIEASGTIEGTDVNIGTEVSGKVIEVRVDEGSRVTKGDTLVLIDDTDYQIQLKQAVANQASFESSYSLAVEGSRKEDIIQAQTAFKTAEADYLRMKDLLASQTITQKQYDDAYTRYVTAQQTYEKLRTGSRPQEITGARTRRDFAAAQTELLKKKIRDCHILAPSNGTITLRAVEPGELVTVGANVLRLTYLDKVKLTIYVSEAELGRVKLGQSASVYIDTDEKKAHNGTVIYISPVAEFTPKNVQTKEERTKLVFGVKIEVDNANGVLKPGLPADAKILTGQM